MKSQGCFCCISLPIAKAVANWGRGWPSSGLLLCLAGFFFLDAVMCFPQHYSSLCSYLYFSTISVEASVLRAWSKNGGTTLVLLSQNDWAGKQGRRSKVSAGSVQVGAAVSWDGVQRVNMASKKIRIKQMQRGQGGNYCFSFPPCTCSGINVLDYDYLCLIISNLHNCLLWTRSPISVMKDLFSCLNIFLLSGAKRKQSKWKQSQKLGVISNPHA